MRNIDTRKYEMLIRVRDFGESHGDLFPASTRAADAFKAVAGAVEQVGAHAVAKKSTRSEGVKQRAIARRALSDRLEVMSRTARAIAAETPGLEDKFGMLPGRKDADFLTTGRQFVQDAAALKPQFIQHGMPKTFLDDLEVLVDGFAEAIRSTEEGKGDNSKAIANITTALGAGMAAAKRLDVIVPNTLAGDSGMLAKWTRERRIEYPAVRGRKGKKVEEGAPAPVAA